MIRAPHDPIRQYGFMQLSKHPLEKPHALYWDTEGQLERG